MYEKMSAPFQKSAVMQDCSTWFKELLSLVTELKKHLAFYKQVRLRNYPFLLSVPVFDLICEMVDIHHCLVDAGSHEFSAGEFDQWLATYWHEGLRKGVGYRFQTGSKSRSEYHGLHIF